MGQPSSTRVLGAAFDMANVSAYHLLPKMAQLGMIRYEHGEIRTDVIDKFQSRLIGRHIMLDAARRMPGYGRWCLVHGIAIKVMKDLWWCIYRIHSCAAAAVERNIHSITLNENRFWSVDLERALFSAGSTFRSEKPQSAPFSADSAWYNQQHPAYACSAKSDWKLLSASIFQNQPLRLLLFFDHSCFDFQIMPAERRFTLPHCTLTGSVHDSFRIYIGIEPICTGAEKCLTFPFANNQTVQMCSAAFPYQNTPIEKAWKQANNPICNKKWMSRITYDSFTFLFKQPVTNTITKWNAYTAIITAGVFL